eukprot:354921-Chlamydomonas_euryale.AAC.10
MGAGTCTPSCGENRRPHPAAVSLRHATQQSEGGVNTGCWVATARAASADCSSRGWGRGAGAGPPPPPLPAGRPGPSWGPDRTGRSWARESRRCLQFIVYVRCNMTTLHANGMAAASLPACSFQLTIVPNPPHARLGSASASTRACCHGIMMQGPGACHLLEKQR